MYGAGRCLLSGPAITVGLVNSNCGLPNTVASVPTRSTETIAFSMNRLPSFFGSLHRCGQVEWHPEQLVAKSCFPLAAFSRSILPRISSGHDGGARRRNRSSLTICPLMSTVESNSPSAGVFDVRSILANTPMTSPNIALDRIFQNAAPLRPSRLRDVPDKR